MRKRQRLIAAIHFSNDARRTLPLERIGLGEGARQPLVFRSEGMAIPLFHASRAILGMLWASDALYHRRSTEPSVQRGQSVRSGDEDWVSR